MGKIRAQSGGVRFVVENSPVGSSQSNGVAKKAIQSVQGHVRVLKLALEKRWGINIPHRHSVIPWVVEYAAFLLNRTNGKTAYESLKGKRAKTLGIEFGEGFRWRMKQAKGALGKLDSLWRVGVYLGIKGKTGEIIVGDAEEVWRTRTIRRKPEAEMENHTRFHGALAPREARLGARRRGTHEDEDDFGIFKDVRFYPILNFGHFLAPLFSRCFYPIMNFGHFWALPFFKMSGFYPTRNFGQFCADLHFYSC